MAKISSRERFFEQQLATLNMPIAYKALNIVRKIMRAENGFQRHDGSHYYYHCIEVAQILLNFGIRDENIIVASLLHDIVEDVEGWTREMLIALFNEEVADLVMRVTKLPNVNYKDPENMVKYLTAIQEKEGSALIKTADRMHNFSTLRNASLEKRLKQAIETETYFIPFFKVCRNEYPWHSAFFFFAKSAIEPHLYSIKEHYADVQKLKDKKEE